MKTAAAAIHGETRLIGSSRITWGHIPLTGERRYCAESANEQHRTVLTITWNEARPQLIFFLLNPSTANGLQDDTTVRIMIGRARRMGCGGIAVINLFSYRVTDSKALFHVKQSDLELGNRAAWRDVCAGGLAVNRMVIAGWGDGGLLHQQWRAAHDFLAGGLGWPIHCLGTTKAGMPRHPLRIGYDVEPRLWHPPG